MSVKSYRNPDVLSCVVSARAGTDDTHIMSETGTKKGKQLTNRWIRVWETGRGIIECSSVPFTKASSGFCPVPGRAAIVRCSQRELESEVGRRAPKVTDSSYLC